MTSSNGNPRLNGGAPQRQPPVLVQEAPPSASPNPVLPPPDATQETLQALSQQPPPPPPKSLYKPQRFEHPSATRQSSGWSRWIMWTLILAVTGALGWASRAEIEQAVPALGKLEPEGTVREVQVPLGGVVSNVLVEEGQMVNKGDLLVQMDADSPEAQVDSLQQVRKSIKEENQFYQSQLKEQALPVAVVPTSIAPQRVSLTESRAALVAENLMFRAQLNGSPEGLPLRIDQLERLRSNQVEVENRIQSARLEEEQLRRQLNQTRSQLSNAIATWNLNISILEDVTPLAEQGGVARIQYLKQLQETEDNYAQYEQLQEEEARLLAAISQAQKQIESVSLVDQRDLLNRIADNDKRIAEIDSQLAKAILENDKQITEIESQLVQARQTQTYGAIRSPVTGTVFDVKAVGAGFVANSSEPILKIVPSEALVAQVAITNQDIGFVREGMPVDVRIDSFPFSEFGDIKGKLVSIGSDALPPTEIQPYYTFPAEIELDQQYLEIADRQIELQSGMSLTANIKVRSRTVLSIFTDMFTKTAESLKTVR